MQIAKKVQQGFTLIELMIVVAIIGILASIAIPQYEAFINRSEFKIMETAAAPYKLGVEMCVQDHRNSPVADRLTGCDSPREGNLGDIPGPIVAATRADEVETLDVLNGVITVESTGGAFGTIAPATVTYILTPTLAGESVVWTFGGTCADPAMRLCR